MGKRLWLSVAVGATLASSVSVEAGEAGDLLREHLYAGTLEEGLAAVTPLATEGVEEARFAAGFLELALGLEGLAQDLYRYGATVPDTTAAGMLLGLGIDEPPVPANPDPEPVTYTALREMLADFSQSLDKARDMLETAGEAGDYVVVLDPLLFRMDIDGDGTADDTESIGALLTPLMELNGTSVPDAPGFGQKTKAKAQPDVTIGFDRADAYWLAGYSQVLAAQADFMLAHDFEEMFNAYFHRVFPRSDLPMQGYTNDGMLMIDPQTDIAIADFIAALHTADFPVVEPERLKGVLARLGSVTDFSRRNWEAILAETDDQRELVPSPSQTSIIPETQVTQERVDAWMATLDTADAILAGELLVPHWRFKQGFDLKAYFETATETDFVMILTGYGALPFLKDGPIADAESFAEANRVFGNQLIEYAFWFN